MPAPKRPNTEAATKAAAARLRRIRIDAAAELLRQSGWTVTPPETENGESCPSSPLPAT